MKIKSTLHFILIAIGLNAATTANTQAVNVQDSLALVDLYNSTNGPGWGNNTNWLAGPVETWYGITVSDSRVTMIDLYDNNLNGSIPASIGNLEKLKVLFMPYNHLSGGIPPELGNLSNLTNLYLGGNQLSGSIPPELGNLSNLLFLILFTNQFSGSIPPEISKLANLAVVQLFENQLTGNIPPELGNLSNNLGLLDLSNNQLSGSIPPELGNLKYVYSLLLSNNQLSGSIPPELGNLDNPSADYLNLYLDHNQLSGSIPPELGNVKRILELNLSYNQLSGKIPAELGNISFIYYEYDGSLDLSHNQLSGSIPPDLGNLVNLNYLDLSSNKLSGESTSKIGNLKKLTYLHLDHNNFRGTISSAITNLPLNELDLSYNHFTFDGMELVAQTFPFAKYDKQKRIPVQQNGNTLSVSAGGTLSNNTYRWYRIGQTGYTQIKGDSVFHPMQNGIYFARIANSVATELILKSDTIKYKAPDPIVASSNVMQLNKITNSFFVYPVPAKNILHVQTNGSGLFSLVSQAGNMLRSSKITNSGTIDVSGLPAGLYYLKNNSTGAAQKVIVIK